LDSLEVEKDSSLNALASQVSDEIRRTGLDILLNKLKLPLLHALCEKLDIEILPTASRKLLVESLVEGEVPEAKARKVEQITKKKPALAKGVNVESILYHYVRPDLQEFLEKHKITANGKKRELAKRIVEYLEEKDEKEEKTPKTDTPKKDKTPKKDSTPKKDNTPKKDKTPKTDKGTPKKEDEEKVTGKRKRSTRTDKGAEEKEAASEEKKTSTPKKTPEKGKRKAEAEADKTKSPKKPKTATSADKPLKDTVFAIAGKFEGATHTSLERQIKKLGGKVDNLGSTTTHYLVPDPSATNDKIKKAKEDNVKVVGPEILKA